ncbi:MAG: hypothetical protein ACR2GG_00160 [Gemmatimonadaceae bacterium]
MRTDGSDVSRNTTRSLTLVLSAAALAGAVGGCRQEPRGAGGPYGNIVAQAVPAVERAVGLRFKTPPKIETRSKAQVRAFLVAQLDEPQARRDIVGTQQAYALLGLIPDTLDLRKLEENLLAEQIVGFYDPKTKVLYVVDGAARDIVKMVVTHELVHALQDQYVSLDSVQKAAGDNDRQTAAQAVFEGQAVYSQMVTALGAGNVAVQLPGGWDRIRETIRNNRAAMPVYSGSPLVLQETLIFPYLSGAEFIRNYKDRNPTGTLYNDMPVSTEQILHQYAYFGTRDAPTPVTFAPSTAVRPKYDNDLGEFETRLFLYQHLNNQEDANRGAAGWDGDRFIVFDTPMGAAIAWATVWDTPNDATDFYNLMQRVGDTDKSAQRSTLVTTGEVGGRPVVLWLDVPAGSRTDAVTLANIRIGPAR